jgi:hypothetical protein
MWQVSMSSNSSSVSVGETDFAKTRSFRDWDVIRVLSLWYNLPAIVWPVNCIVAAIKYGCNIVRIQSLLAQY